MRPSYSFEETTLDDYWLGHWKDVARHAGLDGSSAATLVRVKCLGGRETVTPTPLPDMDTCTTDDLNWPTPFEEFLLLPDGTMLMLSGSWDWVFVLVRG